MKGRIQGATRLFWANHLMGRSAADNPGTHDLLINGMQLPQAMWNVAEVTAKNRGHSM